MKIRHSGFSYTTRVCPPSQTEAKLTMLPYGSVCNQYLLFTSEANINL